MEIPKLSNIPLFLEADTKSELIELMYTNNAINGRSYNYMSPLLDGKKWVVWFYADIENHTMPDKKKLIKNVEIK